MKLTSFSFLLVAAFSWAGCNNNSPSKGDDATASEQGQHTDVAHEHNFACPMHPEEKGHEGDKCPKCGMDMVPMNKGAMTKEYTMMMKAEPQQMIAQQQGTLLFTPKVKGNETEKVPLDVMHDKKIHLIVVSNDLSYFDHVHPEFQSSGDYKIEVNNKAGVDANGIGHSTTQFPNGGDYTLYADYMPTGGTHQVEKIPLHVEGSLTDKKKWTKASLVSKDKEFTLGLKPSAGKFFTGETMHIDAPLMMVNKPVKTNELDNFLGAKAHMVVIGVNDMSYLHVHPEEHDGVLDLHADFEKPGFYRAWVQFQYHGELHTMSFVIEVEEGTASETTEHGEQHNHGEEHKH